MYSVSQVVYFENCISDLIECRIVERIGEMFTRKRCRRAMKIHFSSIMACHLLSYLVYLGKLPLGLKASILSTINPTVLRSRQQKLLYYQLLVFLAYNKSKVKRRTSEDLQLHQHLKVVCNYEIISFSSTIFQS